MTRLLLGKGADVSTTNVVGWTPLLVAAMCGHEAVTRLLLDRGADVSTGDYGGWAPLRVAAICGHEADSLWPDGHVMEIL